MFARLAALPRTVEHMVLQTGGSPWLRPLIQANAAIYVGIPVAYPRMVFLESALDSKLNPLVALGRSGSLGLSGFVNKFNADAELLDDLVSRPSLCRRAILIRSCQNDHWTAKAHKVPRYTVRVDIR